MYQLFGLEYSSDYATPSRKVSIGFFATREGAERKIASIKEYDWYMNWTEFVIEKITVED